MRTILWVSIATLLTATAVQALELSSRHFSHVGSPAPCVDPGEHGDIESSHSTR